MRIVRLYANVWLGYKEYKTERVYMAKMGNWRDNNDIEIPLDGIGGVNILVKADVHRSGKLRLTLGCCMCANNNV